MGYDLYFFKHKTNKLTTDQIGDYLSTNLAPINDRGNQWWFNNEDTQVYFSFETIEESEEDKNPFTYEDYENTGIMFNINFIRPSFFGLEAFRFIERFLKDLELFVVNPQFEDATPYKPTQQELFENWNKTNLWSSKENFDTSNFFMPPEKSNAIWLYNYNRKILQEELGEGYFVSKIFFCKRRKDNEIVTISVWTEHIPNILPDTDYYLFHRKYKKLFRTIADTVLLPKSEFNKIFGDYFEPYHITDTIIIHPENAASAGKIFNGVKSELDFKRDLEGVNYDLILNATNKE